jgi:hypothetical protein
MRKRLIGLFASTMVVFAACQGAASPSASSPGASTPATSAAPGASSSAEAPSASADEINLTNTSYAPEDGPDGGSIIIGDWQEANLFNPF